MSCAVPDQVCERAGRERIVLHVTGGACLLLHGFCCCFTSLLGCRLFSCSTYDTYCNNIAATDAHFHPHVCCVLRLHTYVSCVGCLLRQSDVHPAGVARRWALHAAFSVPGHVFPAHFPRGVIQIAQRCPLSAAVISAPLLYAVAEGRDVYRCNG